MIDMPKLSPKQADDFKVMREMNGYKLLKQVIEDSIGLKNAELINYDWKIDDNGEPNKKSVILYRDKQAEATLLKKLFVFLEKPVIIPEKKSKEVYDGYDEE